MTSCLLTLCMSAREVIVLYYNTSLPLSIFVSHRMRLETLWKYVRQMSTVTAHAFKNTRTWRLVSMVTSANKSNIVPVGTQAQSTISQPAAQPASDNELSVTELRELIGSYVKQGNSLEELMNLTNRIERNQAARIRKAVTANPPKFNGEPESFRKWVGMFGRLHATMISTKSYDQRALCLSERSWALGECLT